MLVMLCRKPVHVIYACVRMNLYVFVDTSVSCLILFVFISVFEVKLFAIHVFACVYM